MKRQLVLASLLAFTACSANYNGPIAVGDFRAGDVSGQVDETGYLVYETQKYRIENTSGQLSDDYTTRLYYLGKRPTLEAAKEFIKTNAQAEATKEGCSEFGDENSNHCTRKYEVYQQVYQNTAAINIPTPAPVPTRTGTVTFQ